MKILFVTASLTSGGSERVMSLLANAFVERGYEVCIVCLTSRKVYYTLSEKVQVVFAADFAVAYGDFGVSCANGPPMWLSRL